MGKRVPLPGELNPFEPVKVCEGHAADYSRRNYVGSLSSVAKTCGRVD